MKRHRSVQASLQVPSPPADVEATVRELVKLAEVVEAGDDVDVTP